MLQQLKVAWKCPCCRRKFNSVKCAREIFSFEDNVPSEKEEEENQSDGIWIEIDFGALLRHLARDLEELLDSLREMSGGAEEEGGEEGEETRDEESEETGDGEGES